LIIKYCLTDNRTRTRDKHRIVKHPISLRCT